MIGWCVGEYDDIQEVQIKNQKIGWHVRRVDNMSNVLTKC